MVVYGDYDVDGITATCTLVDYLRSKGAKCEYYDSQSSDGRLRSDPSGDGAAVMSRARLLITVDSGITATEEIAVARELGMQVVITDHRECHEKPCRTRRRSWTASGRTIPIRFPAWRVSVRHQADLRTRGRHAFRARPVRRP